jgi:hypothetical protein
MDETHQALSAKECIDKLEELGVELMQLQLMER